MIVFRRWVMTVALTFGAAAAVACSPDDQGGECATTDDCPDGQSCLFDAPRGTTYCTSTCELDLDCPDTRECRQVDPNPGLSGGGAGALCIDRVRLCEDEEVCNGLDDDCDGVIDDDCADLACRNETQCGAFSCAAPVGAEETVCRARPEDAPRTFYGPCAQGDDCPNGICEAGLCTPLCLLDRSETPEEEKPDCPNELLLDLTGDGVDDVFGTICAEQIGPEDRPPRNACQIVCDDSSDCPEPLECVWRRVWPFQDLHTGVCSPIDPARMPLGAACPDNSVASDNACQFGICRFQVCTRFCEGPSDPCDDVGDGFVCARTQFTYTDPNFRQPFIDFRDICRPPL